MTFETEYQLQEFREVQEQYFDEDGVTYTSIHQSIMEQMLKLINQLELEIKGKSDTDLDQLFRGAISHALLGNDEGDKLSKETFDLIVDATVEASKEKSQ